MGRGEDMKKYIDGLLAGSKLDKRTKKLLKEHIEILKEYPPETLEKIVKNPEVLEVSKEIKCPKCLPLLAEIYPEKTKNRDGLIKILEGETEYRMKILEKINEFSKEYLDPTLELLLSIKKEYKEFRNTVLLNAIENLYSFVDKLLLYLIMKVHGKEGLDNAATIYQNAVNILVRDENILKKAIEKFGKKIPGIIHHLLGIIAYTSEIEKEELGKETIKKILDRDDISYGERALQVITYAMCKLSKEEVEKIINKIKDGSEETVKEYRKKLGIKEYKP